MKYLKLDARHTECHGLARALVGSPTDYQGQLLGVFDCALMVVDLGDHGLRLDAEWVEVVRLPLATLKLCPYVAMREGVSICITSASGDRQRGVIVAINEHDDYVLVNRSLFDWTQYEHDLSPTITLDLDNLPKGAEVVE